MNVDHKVDDGQVVSMHYTLRVNERIVDTSEGGEPLKFIQGMGHIIPGLERQLYNMSIGESKEVVVAPRDGYGEMDSEAFMNVPRDSFPPNVPLKVGTELELRDQGDHPVFARIEEVTEANVRLNMNHPLAGQELRFSIEIADVRPATTEELTHGHVHTGGAHQ